MTESIRVLQAEDSDLDAELVLHELKRAGLTCESRRVQTEPEFRRALEEFDPQIILSDFSMPGFGGVEALRICREAGIDVPFIFVSGTIGEDVAVEAMKAGADDYVMKTNLIRLGPTVRRALREAGVRWGGRVVGAALRRAQGMAKLAHVITAPDGAFESWSDTLPGLIGVDAARMPRSTRECLEIVHPEDRAMFRYKAIEAGAKGARTELEYRLRHASGGWTHIRHLMEPLHDQAGAAGKIRWFNTLQDVSEQQKNLELANAMRAKDRFLATMSHELRTPLNAIIGFTGTLLMKLPGPLNADQEKQLTTVQGSARHLLSLINDMLDLAKVEAGKMELNLEPATCNDVLQQAAASLRPLAERKGLELRVALPREDLVLQIDRRALSQIVLNLANNAIKFTEHGSVRLALARRRTDGKDVIEISVEDTGVGIRPEDQARLFTAFTQVDAAIRHQEGTGLGLHLSQKLAELLGGTITCRSEYGIGSTFTLQLPEV